ncbi:hypothetical protein C1H46_019740 [Malus baccata]|uniref:Uncharacterized protein n=1 Tax=Malus baccata TaxID=106549 RepID=A0A540M7L7_MALBA|nr:hypothetical protein C1H46_019740 [Malus baccata]
MHSVGRKPFSFFLNIILVVLLVLAPIASGIRTYPTPNVPDYKSQGASETPAAVPRLVLLDLKERLVAVFHHVVLSKRPIPPSGPSHRSNKAPNSSRHLLLNSP